MVSATSGDLILRSSSVRKATCQGQLAVFSVIQMQPSRHFHLAVDSLDLRRGASWSQIIDQAQDLPEQVPRHRHLGQLERDVPPVAHHVRSDLHQLFPQCGHRPVRHLLRQGQSPHEVGQIVGQGMKLEPCDITNQAGRYPLA